MKNPRNVKGSDFYVIKSLDFGGLI
jgi:hypothetical protein